MPAGYFFSLGEDRQLRSKELNAVDRQGELPLTRKPQQQPVADEVIFGLPSMTAAVRLSINVSGLEEKEIYLALDVDAGHWTRIMKGDAHFPLDKLNGLADLVGNEIPLAWWAHSRGKGLHMLETESERLLKAEHEARVKAEEKLRYLESLHTGRAL